MTAARGMWWWSVRRAARRARPHIVKFLVDGFGALAVMFGTVPPAVVEEGKQWWPGSPDSMDPRPEPPGRGTRLPLDEPPPAHPERLVVEVPLTPCERELWAQLEGNDWVEGPGRPE